MWSVQSYYKISHSFGFMCHVVIIPVVFFPYKEPLGQKTTTHEIMHYQDYSLCELVMSLVELSRTMTCAFNQLCSITWVANSFIAVMHFTNTQSLCSWLLVQMNGEGKKKKIINLSNAISLSDHVCGATVFCLCPLCNRSILMSKNDQE